MKNEDLKEILDAKFSGIKAEIKATGDLTNYKIDELITHQKEQNGRIGCLENETRFFRLMHKNPRISIVILILLITGGLVLFPYILKAIF